MIPQRYALAQENTVVHLEGMPKVVKLGKRGRKFLEYDRLRVWQAKHRALRERIWLAKHRFLQRNINRLPISRVDLELEAQATQREVGDSYWLHLPKLLDLPYRALPGSPRSSLVLPS